MSLLSSWSGLEEGYLLDDYGGVADAQLEDARGRGLWLLGQMLSRPAYRYCLHYHCILLIIVYPHL